LCITEPDNGFILSGKSVKEYYNKGNLVKIIDPSLREHMGSYSMTRFSEIAYRCLNDDREQRPSMDIVAKELEETLNVHVRFIPATRFLPKDGSYNKLETLSLPESRFKRVIKLGSSIYYRFTCRLETYMFSPEHYNYACYLVFKLEDGHVLSNDVSIFDPEEESGSSKSIDGGPRMSKHYVDPATSWVEKRDDGWWEARLTRPLWKNHLETLTELRVDLWKIKGRSLKGIIVEGIEFRPVVVDNNGWIISSG
ncbi:serine-threonine/tyrosine-protein kinase catalytic domain-containing protein, partial [Tanacetum coccineum]